VAGRFVSTRPLLINEEIEGMQQVWDVPMAGMFSKMLELAAGRRVEILEMQI